jgi:ABC-type histidine transport system ATPase subunit
VSQEYSFALTQTVRLNNHRERNLGLFRNGQLSPARQKSLRRIQQFFRILFFGFLFLSHSQIVEVVGQTPRSREEIKLHRVETLQAFKVFGEVGLTGNLKHSRKVVNFLIGLELAKKAAVDTQI